MTLIRYAHHHCRADNFDDVMPRERFLYKYPILRSFDVMSGVGLEKVVNKQSSWQRYETSWRSYDIIVMSALSSADKMAADKLVMQQGWLESLTDDVTGPIILNTLGLNRKGRHFIDAIFKRILMHEKFCKRFKFWLDEKCSQGSRWI